MAESGIIYKTITYLRKLPFMKRFFSGKPRVEELLTGAYLTILFIGLPLVYHNGFFDMVETKCVCFWILSAVYTLSVAIVRLVRREQADRMTSVRFGWSDACLLLFLACFALGAALSVPASGVYTEALLGVYNRYQGGVTLAVYAAVYFTVSRNVRFSEANVAAMCVGLVTVCILAILNDLRLDPLGMYHHMLARDDARYISTLGNVNFYASYLGILLPAMLGIFCKVQRRAAALLTGACLFVAALGIAPSASDGLGLALLATFAAAPFGCFGDKTAMRRCLTAVLLLLGGLLCSRALRMLLPVRFYAPYFVRMLSYPAVAGVIAVLALYGLLRLQRGGEGWLLRAKKRYALLLCASAAAAVALIMLANTVFADVSFGSLDRFIKLNGAWGTDRGGIWAQCLKAYDALPPIEKLFGGGPSCLYAYDANHRLFADAALDAAHNEYLQYLLTVGVCGLLAYAGLMVKTLADGWRALRSSANPVLFGLLLGILGYAAEALVGIAQPVSTPFLFLFLALARGLTRQTGTDAADASQNALQSGDDCAINGL